MQIQIKRRGQAFITIVILFSLLTQPILLILNFFSAPLAKAQEINLFEGQRQELIDQRDAYTKFYKIMDPSVERGYRIEGEVTTERIHYPSYAEASEGKPAWKEINNNIVQTNWDGYSYRNAANDFQVYFGTTAEQGFRYIGNGLDIKIGEIQIGDQEIQNSSAMVEANIITYPEILPNIDLKYIVHSNGFYKQIILKSQNALQNNLAKISYEILRSNRQLKKTGGEKGEIQVQGLEYALDFLNPFTFDSQGKSFSEEGIELNNSSIIIKPDLNYLNSAERIFPIIIDPGIQVKDPWEDTFVAESTWGVPQGGWAPVKPLFVGNHYDPAVPAWYTKSRTFLKFPPINQPVISAKLRVYQYGTTGWAHNVDIKAIGDFSETSLAWPNGSMSGDYGDLYFPYIVQQANSYQRDSTNISSLVNNQLGTGRVLIGLQSQNEASWHGASFVLRIGHILTAQEKRRN